MVFVFCSHNCQLKQYWSVLVILMSSKFGAQNNHDSFINVENLVEITLVLCYLPIKDRSIEFEH